MIRVGVVDLGVGVYSSYVRSGQVNGRPSIQLVQDVFNELESSLNVPGKPFHRGLGLPSVADFLKGVRGQMHFYTSGMLARIDSEGKLSVAPCPTNTLGTFINLVVPVR